MIEIKFLGLRLRFELCRFTYYEIVSDFTGKVVGMTTSDGLDDVGCDYSVRRTSKANYDRFADNL